MVHQKLNSKLVGEFPLIWGPFLVGTMWILKYTYGRFYLYLITNLVVDSAFIYAIMSLLEKSRLVTLNEIKKFQMSILFFVKSVFLYGFQFMVESLIRDSD